MTPSLVAVAETLARPGLLGLVGKTAEKRLTSALQSYFRILGRRVAGLNLERLHEHEASLARHAVAMRLHNTLRILTPLLKTTLKVAIQDAMLKADKIHHFAEAEDSTTDDQPDDYVGLTAQDAAAYAEQQAAQTVTGIDETTVDLIADAVSEGITEQLGVDGTARLIRQTLEDMTVRRSEMIASTELNDAFSQAALMKLDRMGVGYKQWITATQCCDICAENEDASPIPVDEDFPSGDDAPPAHVNCRCALTGARAPEE